MRTKVRFCQTPNRNLTNKLFIPGAAGGVQTYAELRTSLNSIVDAMRDFLSNIRVPERPNDADVDENEESSDDEPNDYLT